MKFWMLFVAALLLVSTLYSQAFKLGLQIKQETVRKAISFEVE